jgi:pSer/pThr/pTyr-binding forkhead associated (FHA) protein
MTHATEVMEGREEAQNTMAAFLIVQRGEDIGRRFDLDTTQLTVGRGSDNDMVLNDPMVSRYHAVVKRQGNGYLVIDLGSSNPVVINEHVCEPGEPRILQHRDVVFIGKTVFSFQSRSGGAITGPATRPKEENTIVGARIGGPAEMESPTPPPPSRTPAAVAAPAEERTSASTPKLDPSTAPSMPAAPPTPPAPPSKPESDADDKTMVAGMVRPPEPSPAPFMPPPPPGGMRSIDDDSTRPTPGMPPMGAGAPPPPPPPPPFAPPRAGSPPAPPLGGPNDEGDGDMPTQIVPRRP